VVKVTDFGMSRIIPEKIQDIEKGVEVPADRSPVKKDQSVQEEEGRESKTGNGNNHGDGSTEAEEETNEASQSKKRVNFNEEANTSWERESILNPDDSSERHSNLMVRSSLPSITSPCD
jgi:cobalamin biosynthesis protein CobT